LGNPFKSSENSLPSDRAMAPNSPRETSDRDKLVARDWVLFTLADDREVVFDPIDEIWAMGTNMNPTLHGVSAAKFGGVGIRDDQVIYTPAPGNLADDFFTYTVQYGSNSFFSGFVTIKFMKTTAEEVIARTQPHPNLELLIDRGEVVFLEPRTYVRQSAVVSKSTSIFGTRTSKEKPILRFLGSKESKGGLLVKGVNLHLENVELWEAASASSGNGAGIRFESAKGVQANISCTDVAFRFCENGVLGPDNTVQGGKVSFLRCEFDRNGRYKSGQEHGAYIGLANELVVDTCHFHDTYTGHELKTRAKKSILRNSRFGSTDSRASYEAEFPNGGDVLITDCTFIQGKLTDNNFVIGFGAEWNSSSGHSINRLIVRNCVFWNFHPDGYVLRVDPKVPSPIVEFHDCTFVNFTQNWNPNYAVSAVMRTGLNNRALSLLGASAEGLLAPELPDEHNLPNFDSRKSLASTLEARAWYQIEGTYIPDALSLETVPEIPHLTKQLQVQNIIDAWGGASYRNGKAICLGTGHGDGAINARAEFDCDQFKWTWASPQSAQKVVAMSSPYASDTPKDPLQIWHTRPFSMDESNKSKVTIDGFDRILTGQYPDGLPAPVHGWTNAFTLRNGNFGNFNRTMDIAIFQRTEKKWKFLPFPNRYTSIYSMLVQVDEKTDSVWARVGESDVFEFHDIEKSARYKAHRLPEVPTHACIVDREIWYFCRPHGDVLVRLNMDSGAISSVVLEYPKAHSGMHFSDGSGCVYAPEIGVLRMDMFGRLWGIDPDTFVCEPFYVRKQPPAPTNGIWSRIWQHRGYIFAILTGKSGVGILRL
jgi:hypothetical protein